MDKELLKEKLAGKIPAENIVEDAPMAQETTFRCGGSAALFVTTDSVDDLRYALSVIRAFGAKWMILGNGSNVLFKDSGYDGVVIKLGKDFSGVAVDGCKVYAGAAALLSFVSKLAASKGLTGLEFASGIPGSLGGGVYMNAGAYGGSISDCIVSVIAVTPDGEIYKYEKDELELSYRHSRFMDSGEIIIDAEFELKEGDPEAIQETMADLARRRKEKQPLSFPSAGSFFKRPEGYFAAALIDQAGLKGLSVGDAQVSELHAGFIVNKGNATASEVLELASEVSRTVKEKYGVELEPEVRIVGD